MLYNEQVLQKAHIQAGLRQLPCASAAYHHFGMVSPFKVARDAASSSSNGASKFYDEFATWRELSYAACLRMWPNLETMQVSASAASCIPLHWCVCLSAGRCLGPPCMETMQVSTRTCCMCCCVDKGRQW